MSFCHDGVDKPYIAPVIGSECGYLGLLKYSSDRDCFVARGAPRNDISPIWFQLRPDGIVQYSAPGSVPVGGEGAARVLDERHQHEADREGRAQQHQQVVVGQHQRFALHCIGQQFDGCARRVP
jgi:hypothetical protein